MLCRWPLGNNGCLVFNRSWKLIINFSIHVLFNSGAPSFFRLGDLLLFLLSHWEPMAQALVHHTVWRQGESPV